MIKDLDKWRKVGRIGAEVLNYARSIIKSEMPLLELAQKVEEKLAKLNVGNSFPINLSINEVAAHSSPLYNDTEIAHGLIKIDLGANLDGFLSDNACSVDLSQEQKYSDLIKASRDALNEAIKIIRPGIMLFEIGRIIQDTITAYGFSPVRNLNGHEIKQWDLHAGLTIPNYDNGNMTKLKEGMIVAIEPFATIGEGIVQDGKQSGIYQFIARHNTRDMFARKILDFIGSNYKKLPFSSRWIVKKFGTRALFSLKMLEQVNALHNFKQLVEKTKQPVSQAEHTILVTENGCEVLTKTE